MGQLEYRLSGAGCREPVRYRRHFILGEKMFETLDKVMYAGLGAISMTRERAEKIFDDYVSRGKAEHEEKSGFVKDVMDTADKTRKEMEKIVNEQVSKVIDQMGLAKDVDLRRVEEKIDKLLGKGN